MVKVIFATVEEVYEAACRFPHVPVHQALELNRKIRENFEMLLEVDHERQA